jgi:two-component system sensor histidine kinase PilS (NtrC family)
MLEDALRRLKVLIYSRAIVVTFLFGSFYFFRVGDLEIFTPEFFLYFISTLYFLSIVYFFVLRKISSLSSFTSFVYIQIVIDVIAEITFVYLTGGIGSWFTFTFLLSIISSSIVLNRRASYATASLCSVLYGLLIEFQFYYQVPFASGSLYSEKFYLYNVFTHILAFYSVAFLSGYLSERWQIAIQTLEQKDTYIDHLKALSKDIIESMPSGIFTTTLDGKIATFNTSAKIITGKSFEDIVGKSPQEVFPFLENRIAPFERVEGRTQNNGRTIYVGIRISPLKNSQGIPIGMIGIFQDVTKIKAMEKEIQDKEKWAFIGELSALIAHELRNPLASLKASVEMLLEKNVPQEYADQLMKIAITEMDRLNGIITDFLIYAKPQHPVKDTVDIHKSLSELIVLLRNSLSDKSYSKIIRDFSDTLFITADANQLQQVFWNLGANAVEAISDKGVVTISTARKGNTVEIDFNDTGSGINENDMGKIFYPFFTTKEKGTGLGLAIAQRIVEEHGGKIKVESLGEGAGSTFRVILPADNAGENPQGRQSDYKV